MMLPILAMVIVLLFVSCGSAEETAGFKAWFFNAGKADAILLDANGSYVLIDCGERNTGKELVKALKDKGIRKLDYLIITHFDKDHVGGAPDVLEEIEVGKVLQNSREKDSDEYDDYVEAVKKCGTGVVTVREEYSFELKGAAFKVTPGKGGYDKDKSNNFSLLTSVDAEGVRFLFAGDVQTERIEEMLEDGLEHADVLKLPHHGQEEEKIKELLAAVTPGIAVITSSDKEPESDEVVQALKDVGALVYLTRKGTVCVTAADGEPQVKQ
ncbi:MAG: MBL fold metallo-hydrolase [Lachnospiraceae bacterium]|nr:MBL fold metallo-hydrolase [Lachnospiraceae bacterium]